MLDNIKEIIKAIPVIGSFARICYKPIKYLLALIRQNRMRQPLLHSISEMYNEVESYQPLYNCPIESSTLKRSCIDRCKTIEQALVKLGRNFRLLDVGCSLGYFSFYFAERGANVVGIDFSPHNIALAKAVREFNRIPVDFQVRDFNEEFIEELPDKVYDVAFVLSVFHHIIHSKGLAYAQRLLNKLVSKVPIVIIELAMKKENVPYPWQESLPDDSTKIFEDCADSEIVKIGEFSTHLSDVKRPLFMVRQKSIIVNGKQYKIDHITQLAYQNAPGLNRTFCFGPEVFVKRYRICEGPHRPENLRQIFREVSNFDLIGSRLKRFPILKDVECGRNEISVVFERLDATNLVEVLSAKRKIDPRKVFMEILNAVAELRKVGLYHNDLRTWNVMVNDNDVFLIDLGLAALEERDDTIYALLQILWDVQRGEATIDVGWPIKGPPSQNPKDYDESLQDLVGKLLACENIDVFFKRVNVFGQM